MRLRLAMLLAAAIAACAAPAANAAAAAPPRDYSARTTFDALDRAWNDGRGNAGQTNDAPVYARLAWGESFILQAYLVMYETYHDPVYVATFVDQADRVLASRDSVRGVTDYLGRSLPAWRARDPYTVGTATLRDASGRPVLEVRSALAAADGARAVVTPAGGDRFTLTVTNDSPRNRRPGPDGTVPPPPTDRYEDLSMSRESPDYAVTRVNGAFAASRVRVTVADVGDGSGAPPAPGATQLASRPYVFAVHTGMITYPLARFVRLVRETPALREDPRLADRAETYLHAVEEAVAVHDPEWRENAAGDGTYVVPRGAPVAFDGTELPLNQSLALGRTLAELAAITGRPDYAEKVRALAGTFAGELRPAPNGAVTWSYALSGGRLFRGWSASDGVSEYQPSYPGLPAAEDIDHGHIDVGFAADAVSLGLAGAALGADGVLRMAAAFSSNVMRTGADGLPTAAANVDGTGATGVNDVVAPLWMPLAGWDPEVFARSQALYAARQPELRRPEVLLASAYLNALAHGVPVV